MSSVASNPVISVVMATHDRPERLRNALSALRKQTLGADSFEVIVVDDASGAATAALLAAEAERPGPALTVLRQDRAAGPASARNRGWRSSRADLIAFIDDDCEATPGWLEALLAASGSAPGSIVQGPTLPIPAEISRYGPFSHTVRIDAPSRGLETANILYPRELLERLGGFDEEALPFVGEDTDLGWRALAAGAGRAWAPDALVHHAVTDLGPVGKLRSARRFGPAMLVYARHPGLRRTRALGIFWNRHHQHFVLALLALLLPRRLRWLRPWLAGPYVKHLLARRSGPLLAPYLIAYDALETSSIVRGSLRHGVLVV